MSYQNNDDYEPYEAEFDPLQTNRQARRKRKPKARHVPKHSPQEVQQELAEESVGLERGFQISYQPSLYEAEWLLESIRSFYDESYITDVQMLVKGGKEASVYRCAAHESVGQPFLAAKVYRPRKFRQLRNDQMYREGRGILSTDNHIVKKTEDRIMRAMSKKSSFGKQVQHSSWLMHEFSTLKKLYAAGAAVPQPYAVSDNAILMAYCGDSDLPAPTLNTVLLEEEEAEPLFQEVMRNLQLMLEHGIIHGDLSAYNLLYWEGSIMLIDFPQVTDLEHNSNAASILKRDVQRICEYFRTQGADHDHETIFRELWQRYVGNRYNTVLLQVYDHLEGEG